MENINYQNKIFGNTKIKRALLSYHPLATVINTKSIGENFQFKNSLTIGNNVVIGDRFIVVKDVPSNCVVAVNPAKIIRTLA